MLAAGTIVLTITAFGAGLSLSYRPPKVMLVPGAPVAVSTNNGPPTKSPAFIATLLHDLNGSYEELLEDFAQRAGGGTRTHAGQKPGTASESWIRELSERPEELLKTLPRERETGVSRASTTPEIRIQLTYRLTATTA